MAAAALDLDPGVSDIEQIQTGDEFAGDTGADDVDPNADLGTDGEEPGDDDGADFDTPDEPEAPKEGEVKGPDDRKLPDNIKKALVAIRNDDPAAAKALKGIVHSERAYRDAFPLPADAVAAKQIIEEIGGTEGIASLKTEREEWEAIDRGYAEGKPEFVKGLADGNPEAFLKTAPNVVNEWAERAPEHYGYFRDAVSFNTIMQQPGVQAGVGVLKGLHEQLEGHPAEQQAIAAVVNGIVGLRDRAAEFTQKRVDPREQQLNQREQQFETQRRADFEGKVAGEAETYLQSKMQPEIDRLVNGRSVDPDAMKMFQKLVKEEVEKELGKVPNLDRDLDGHYRTGDAKRSLSYITGKYNAILPNAVKIIEPFLRNLGTAKVAPKGGQQGNGPQRSSSPGEITLKEMPTFDQLDPAFRADPNHVAELMQGRATLKGGKKATGWA